MKKFFTLVALLTCFLGAKAEGEVYKIDYSTYTSFPFYVMGFTPEWVDGIMTDGGGGWHQYFIADGIPTKVGSSYKVKALVKASKQVTMNVNMGWGWGDGQQKGTNVTIPESTEFQEVTWGYDGIGGTSCNLVAQPNTDAKIEWKELIVILPEVPAAPESSVGYGDLSEVTPIIYGKPDSGTPAVLTPDENGVYSVKNTLTDGADHATQFWIAAPYSLPAGQKFYVEFDYKADAATKCGTQTHGEEPGSYIVWHCLGDIEFAAPTEATDEAPASDGWKKYTGTINIDGDMNGWQSIAFNLNQHAENTYYFKNIKLQVPEQKSAISVSVGEAGYATTSYSKAFEVGEGVGFAATFNGTSVVLTPVTKVPAGAGVIIQGIEGGFKKYDFSIIESAENLDNGLLVSDGNVEGDGTIYVLANGEKGVGFYKLASGEKVPAGKAYLQITAGGREFIGFAGEATAINNAKVVKTDGAIYNLAGQQVKSAQKGIFIIDGKKIVVK